MRRGSALHKTQFSSGEVCWNVTVRGSISNPETACPGSVYHHCAHSVECRTMCHPGSLLPRFLIYPSLLFSNAL